MLIFRRKLRIEWGQCDPAGIVYFPRYFEMFDVNGTMMMESAGFPKQKTMEQFDVVGWPLVDTSAKFHAPSSWGDKIEIESRVSEWGRSSFTTLHRLYRGETLCIEASEKRVWVGRHPDDPSKLKSVPIPQVVLAAFEA